jgi:tetratricopeptide (TPR) repeat protein
VRPSRGFALLLALFAAATASAAAAPSGASARLEAAVEEHPDDPDLSWALVRQRAAAGALSDAAARLAAHLERWPDRPGKGWLTLGIWRYELGDDAAAVAALTRALAREPASGASHLYLGLARQRQGHLDAAARHFHFAASLENELRGWAVLLEASARLAGADDAGAQQALVQMLDRDPHSEEARYARLLLEGRAERSAARLRLDAYGGIAFDSNVSLESDADAVGVRSNRSDALVAWGSRVAWRAVRAEGHGLELIARYSQNAHFDLEDFDTEYYGGALAARFRLRERLSLRLDGGFGYTRLDEAPYLMRGRLRPNLRVNLGERWGVLRLFASGEHLDYREEPLFSSLERSGWAYGGGLEHHAPFLRWPDAWLSLGADFTRRDTKASRDLLGFKGAYDHDRWRGTLRARLPLPWRIDADAAASLAGEFYDNRNVIDALSDGGVGAASPNRRRDVVWRTYLILTRPVLRSTDLELVWHFTDRISNVDLYRYDRTGVGLYLRVHTP